MKKIILAELRKDWRGKRVLMTFAAFLCFSSVVHVNCLQKGKAYEDDLIMQLHYQNAIISTRCGDLMYTLQDTPVEKENLGQHEEAYGWYDVIDNVPSWIYLQRTLEYFDWHNTDVYVVGRAETLLASMNRGYYYDELKGYGITEKALETDKAYYRYFEAQDIPPYTTPYEPNLLNFVLQMSQHDTTLLLIVVVSLLMADQICHNYDSDTYKTIYSQPISRKKFITAKVPAAVAVIPLALLAALVAFFVVPLSAYGMGSSAYSYIVYTYDVVSWTRLLQRTLLFSLPVTLFYMIAAALLVSWQKMTSNTMFRTDSLLILIYFLIRIFGYFILLFSWIPFFYIYLMEIATHDFTLDLFPCTILCITGSFVFFLLHIFIVEKRDLGGGVRS